MRETIGIGIIGDFDQNRLSHRATNDALNHAANHLSIRVNIAWIPTQSLLTSEGQQRLEQFAGLWAAPGSPYQSLDGALMGIQIARELNWPFLGTCGGFQHALLEYARNVLGIKDAGHMEYDPNVSMPLIVPASCPVEDRPEGTPMLWGKLKIKVSPDSLVFRIYQQPEVEEWFQCNYELNPAFQDVIEAAGLRVTGLGENGEARIVELTNHRFFLATNFQPQLMSEEIRPHRLIVAYLEAVLNFRRTS